MSYETRGTPTTRSRARGWPATTGTLPETVARISAEEATSARIGRNRQYLREHRKAGATGLEPATSGVTGRATQNDRRPQTTTITLQTHTFQ
jgi:hypothetical protein